MNSSILNTLHAAGHEAYFVGGCVRDRVMGIEPKDWDIATSATPDQVMALFPKHVPIGAKFGVVLVDGHEVATFREEADHEGHLCTVTWTTMIKDASRRDFTINAMYMSASGEITDPFNGTYDIKRGILRTVGKAKTRFAEDPLRMLRAVRFAAKYHMKLSAEIILAMNGQLLDTISNERVRDELLKILTVGGLKLLSDCCLLEHILPEVERLKNVQQDARHPEGDVFTHTNLVVGWARCTAYGEMLPMAALLHDVGKFATQQIHPDGKISFIDHEDSELPEQIMRRLKFSNDQIDTVVWAVKNHMRMHRFFEMKKSKRHTLMRHKDWLLLFMLHRCDCLGSDKGYGPSDAILDYTRTVKLEEPMTVSDRLVTGDDLITIGYTQGKALGEALKKLEEAQREGLFTTREEGIAYAKQTINPGDAP